ncbi:Protein SCD6 [Ceratocystis platani]|uniref:Protein SCD6 n=1 Tax=Ceratocystis fimbriata f. sp. platani TaxID=88771 RepID=A0A0F8CSR9_CERFI|nr:Protein SCD6 [Ceratocystis platani]
MSEFLGSRISLISKSNIRLALVLMRKALQTKDHLLLARQVTLVLPDTATTTFTAPLALGAVVARCLEQVAMAACTTLLTLMDGDLAALVALETSPLAPVDLLPLGEIIPTPPTWLAVPAALSGQPAQAQDQKNVGAKTSQQLPRTAEADSKPAGPKSEAIEKSTPAAPLSNGQAPTTKFQPPVTKSEAASKSLPPPTDAAISDATEAAKAAVALAMARLNAASEPVANPVDNLSNRVNDMRINAATRAPQAPRGGRNQGGRSNRKADVPTEDFDFASANAKFKKDDIKPTTEPAANEEKEVATPNEPTTPAGPVYNKSTSFFDNISSEAKERAANGGHKPGGREWRGEEQRKNMETFGQGSVDGGYRNYRGRGRGGFRGRGRGGQNRGGYQNRQPRPQVEN